MHFQLERRRFLQALAALGVAAHLPSLAEAAAAPGFSVPELGYGFNSLEPIIDTLTMQIHHDKHHAAYVKGLNETLAKNPGALHSGALRLTGTPERAAQLRAWLPGSAFAAVAKQAA